MIDFNPNSAYGVPMMATNNGFNPNLYQSLTNMYSQALGPSTTANSPFLSSGFLGLMGGAAPGVPSNPLGTGLNNLVEQMGQSMYGVDFNFIDNVTGVGALPSGIGGAAGVLSQLGTNPNAIAANPFSLLGGFSPYGMPSSFPTQGFDPFSLMGGPSMGTTGPLSPNQVQGWMNTDNTLAGMNLGLPPQVSMGMSNDQLNSLNIMQTAANQGFGSWGWPAASPGIGSWGWPAASPYPYPAAPTPQSPFGQTGPLAPTQVQQWINHDQTVAGINAGISPAAAANMSNDQLNALNIRQTAMNRGFNIP